MCGIFGVFGNYDNYKIYSSFMKIKKRGKHKSVYIEGDDYKVELQKLILLGKVLEDSKTVGEYGISESSSIVCFASKVRIFNIL